MNLFFVIQFTCIEVGLYWAVKSLNPFPNWNAIVFAALSILGWAVFLILFNEKKVKLKKTDV